MNTPYEEVFSAFLSKIEDKTFAQMVDPDLEKELTSILNDGLIYFKYPKVDVFNKSDSQKTFNVQLTYFEIQLISRCMLKSWIDKRVYRLELLKQVYNTKDFKLTSQAEHLNRLTILQEKNEKELKKLLKDYTYRNGNSPNFSRLASDDL